MKRGLVWLWDPRITWDICRVGQDFNKVRCASCGHVFGDDGRAGTSPLLPCPGCGGTPRRIAIEVSDVISGRDSLEVKGGRRPGLRRPDKKRPYVEATFGRLELHRDEARWVVRDKVVNRADDQYHEVVKDVETGTIVHECHEPLSRHTEHGDARKSSSEGQGKKPGAP